MIRSLVLTGSVVVALGALPAAAVAQDPVPIGPNESFVGLVNGDQANAPIRMACFGPVTPGETGHPIANQYTEVEPVSPVAVAGYTGNAKSIIATYALPGTGLVEEVGSFTNYYVEVKISTQLTFPCSGTGTIPFTPVNGGPTARPWDVTVNLLSGP